MRGLSQKIRQMTLPLMPATTQELRRLLQLPTTRNRQLYDVLLMDPGATIAVFRELERMRPGSSDQVADAGHAVSLLGMETFRQLIAGLPEMPARSLPGAAHAASAYSQAAHAAYYAEAIGERKGMARLDEVATAALLQNPAILALWVNEPESALRATNAVRDGVPADVAFGAELGEPLGDANRQLAAAWALPRLARQSMGDWDDFNPKPQVVRLADEIAQATSLNWQGPHTETITAVLSDFLDVSQDQACAWLHQKAVDAARHFSRIDYPLPGFQLLLMPGEVDNDDDDIPILGSRRREAEARQAAAQRPDIHATMAGIMKRIRSDAGTTRVVFAMLNKERSRLRTRLALGGDKQDGIRRLDIDLAEKTLFSVLMTKPQSVWLNASNAARYRAHLPETLRLMLGSDEAFIMSTFVGSKPLGLLYADGEHLDENGYRRFRELCQEASDALSGKTGNSNAG